MTEKNQLANFKEKGKKVIKIGTLTNNDETTAKSRSNTNEIKVVHCKANQ